MYEWIYKIKEVSFKMLNHETINCFFNNSLNKNRVREVCSILISFILRNEE